MEEEEKLSSQQVHTKKEHSVILESSSGKDKVLEQPINFITERGKFPEVPVEEEKVKYEEGYDLIFKQIDIPWLSDNTSTLQEEMWIDSEIENLQKTVKQYKYRIGFLSETNDRLVITNRRLRGDLDDINTHYHELIAV